MLCANPFVKDGEEYGCGQCAPCRINRRRLWTGRLMLEAQQHEHSCFVTLTYRAEDYPSDGSLRPRDVQLWLKRLRAAIEPKQVRYYAVGEYGTRRGRAHYHVIVFGLSSYDRGAIEGAWPYGSVHIGTLTEASASYVCSYICKGDTRPRVDGRHPEFCRMSLKPGIGAVAADRMAAAIKGACDVATGEYYAFPDGDVVSSFRWDGLHFPLGRYLRKRLRLALGSADAKEPRFTREVRKYKRFVDMSKHGLSGWRVKEDRRLKSLQKSEARYEMFKSNRRMEYETA